MDSNNGLRKYVPGILIMTLIFLGLSIFSINNMLNKQDEKKDLIKGSYINLLEGKLNTKLEGEDEFAIFESIGYDVVVIPDKYNNYYKPCFDFVIVRDGIIIKNSTSKEFLNYPISIGSKIVKIGDIELIGLAYFDIVDLIFSKELNVSKIFTLDTGISFEYKYEKYSNKEEVSISENETTIKIYNLDKFSRKGIYEKATSNEKVIFDLTNASITNLDSMRNFMSYFTKGNEELFTIPSGVKSLESYKLDNATIVVGDNQDRGVLFMISSLKALNANVKIVELKEKVDEYKTYEIIQNADYTIYIYSYVLKTKSSLSNGSGVII